MRFARSRAVPARFTLHVRSRRPDVIERLWHSIEKEFTCES
jgi:hypothetical protein